MDEIKLAGIRLEHPLMNAAGTCRTLEEVQRLSKSASSAIMVGSITLEPRDGHNSGDVYWTEPFYSINSLGLPNRGADYYREYLPAMADSAHQARKPLFVSVVGFKSEEYAQLAALAFEHGADLVELNLGCPNVWKDGEQKRIPCFDPLMFDLILRKIESEIGTDRPISVKLSPFSDPFALFEIASALTKSRVVKLVTAVNTFPNAFLWNESGQPLITPAQGFGGMSGRALKPIALGQIRQLRQWLPEQIQLIGVGGIQFGRDIHDFIRAGASAVQIATAYLNQGEQIFSTLLDQYLEAM